MFPDALAFLLDMAPKTWSTREEFQLRLCRGVLKRSVQPIIAYSEDVPPAVRAPFEQLGVKVLALQYRHGPLPYWRGLRQAAAPHRFRLAHIRFFGYAEGIHWVAKLAGAQKILFAEANSGDFPTRHPLKRGLLAIRNAFLCRPVDHLIAISGFIKERLVECGFPPNEIDIVYNGVDTDRFAPRPQSRFELRNRLGIRDHELVIACVAVLLPYKRVDVLIQAVAQLNQQGCPARLLLLGEGPLRAELQALARAAGLHHQIHFLGHVPNVEWYCQGCDLFALASVGEAFGNVLAEAMACGVPVVASRHGAVMEVVEDGRTGLLANPLQPADFAAAIRKLATDPALRQRMGEAGLQRVRDCFSVDAAVEATLRVYDKLW